MRYLCSEDARSHFLSYLFERKQGKSSDMQGKKSDNNNKSLINRVFIDFAVI